MVQTDTFWSLVSLIHFQIVLDFSAQFHTSQHQLQCLRFLACFCPSSSVCNFSSNVKFCRNEKLPKYNNWRSSIRFWHCVFILILVPSFIQININCSVSTSWHVFFFFSLLLFSVSLQILYKLKTAKIFEKPKRSTDSQDDDPFAIQMIFLCPESRMLLVAGATHVMLFRFCKQELTLEVSVIVCVCVCVSVSFCASVWFIVFVHCSFSTITAISPSGQLSILVCESPNSSLL